MALTAATRTGPDEGSNLVDVPTLDRPVVAERHDVTIEHVHPAHPPHVSDQNRPFPVIAQGVGSCSAFIGDLDGNRGRWRRRPLLRR